MSEIISPVDAKERVGGSASRSHDGLLPTTSSSPTVSLSDMWAKLSHALKPKQAHDESDANFPGEVMAGVLEQHPNLSIFQQSSEQPSPPPSPSKSGRMAMFKRHTKGYDESQRAPSPLKLIPKKVKTTLGIQGNASQLSIGTSGAELGRVSSHDMLSPPAQPKTKRRSSFNLLKRPSTDGLRSPAEAARSPSRAEDEHDQMRDPATPFDAKSGSVRSILRDRNTPGTGQNVRFFSRDAYKVLSPDQSTETDVGFQSAITTALANTTPAPPEETFLERLQRSGSTDSNASSSMPRFASTSSSKKARPTVAEIFSPVGSPEDRSASQAPKPENSDSQLLSQLPPLPAPDFTNIFDMSQELEMPMLPPPGLGFNVEMSLNDHETETEGEGGANAMTSTPYRDKGKGKEREVIVDLTKEKETETLAPTSGVDESIFHAKEKTLAHDRSHSFSAGQTMFYSMAHGDSSKRSSASTSSVLGLGDYPSSAKSSPMSFNPRDSASVSASSASSPGVKGRGRALSDTVFMSMLRSPSGSPSPRVPEADINDESAVSSDLLVYDGAKDEPDPFSAHAHTYYTPATPPHPSSAAHARTASKEDDAALFALKTQLTLQTELCGQFEADLRARDELVEALGKKLSEVEREEAKRRGVLRGWKKKVAELERACRFLEEEVEGSRQESMERSIMDEASGEALRMLHRQIAGHEREREGWKRVEEMLRGELGALEGALRERSEEVRRLTESLWSRDESERELKAGIQEAKREMEMMGNVSIGLIDENDLKNELMAMAQAKDQRNEEERERHKETELGWEDEKEELLAAVETAKLENAGLVAELDNYKQQLKEHDDELVMLKAELEAQWDHSEKGADKLEAAAAAKRTAEMACETLQAKVDELEERLMEMDAEYVEAENKQMELENDIQELWDVKEALEKEQEELQEQIRAQDGQVKALQETLKAREDHVVELGQERQYALDNVARLEENIRRRDAEAAEYSQRTLQREAETEALREQISRMKREHAGALEAVAAAQSADADKQARVAKERAGDLKDEIERLRRQIHELQQESADKEVKIVQITKQRAQDKEDLQGLNIALDSKQQELELLKRRMGVRGTAGSTPAQPSKIGHQRRDSAVFTTPSIGSRPPSVISDAGTDGGSVSGGKIAALGKSSRLNSALSSSTSKPAPRATGSMGPPAPVTKRMSVAGTPTPAARAPVLSRSASAKPTLSGPSPSPSPALHRRVVSATLDQATARAVKARQTVNASPAPSEKENVEAARPAPRARVPVPA
ncbi:hypothetical protein DFH08DRAFT_987672 [Mycena albidolilacea]|uniref:Uncharacterized protein n=1 Tax=Mycena albidolilacea TaxID=1033008 RepID=A0AAD7EXP0_9AGAR|nr:hypothetical protein DFH08DRAFT_987672 [Mycena albidolilacea]